MAKPPFHSFAFTLVENGRPRASLRLAVLEGEGERAGAGAGAGVSAGAGGSGGELYELRVQKGSAANPLSQFTRKVPQEVAERLRDTMRSIGVFGWEESYGDESAPGTCRWTLAVVFEEDVFSLESKGGSDVPAGFDTLLEELYRLDFPRPAGSRAAADATGATSALGTAGAGAGALGALGGLGGLGAGMSSMPGTFNFDPSQLGNLPGFDAAELQSLMSDPQALQRRMKDEFRHLSPSEQNDLLDALAATGLTSRAWWERFFRS